MHEIPIALAGGSLIFLAVIIVVFFAVVYGYYTRRGSGINQRPNDGLDGSPGAQGRSEIAGNTEGEGSSLDEHGTG